MAWEQTKANYLLEAAINSIILIKPLIMLQFFTINTVAEIICFLIALASLTKDKSLMWRLLLIYLFIVCVTEMSAIPIKKRYMADPQHATSNEWLYNLALIVKIFFFSFVFRYLLNKYRKSDIVIWAGFLSLAILYLYEILHHGIWVYNSLTNTIMAIFIVLCSFYYFYALLKNDSYVGLKYSGEFWWVAGILFFYFGSTACNLFYNDIKKVLINNKHYWGYIYNVLNIILYSCWSYAIICRRRMDLKSA
jgi:hypothetical protein